MSERIEAFDGPARRIWTVQGLACATYATFMGNLNGYVRLPESHPDLLDAQHAELTIPPTSFELPDGTTAVNTPRGYDYVDVRVHGGWTYGPDLQNWIGFDTGHAGDIWDPRESAALIPEEMREMWKAVQEAMTQLWDLSADYPYARHWTEALVEEEVTRAAGELAERARAVDARQGQSGPAQSVPAPPE